MKRVLLTFAAILLLPGQIASAQSSNAADSGSNNLTYAVAWKQTAAEYRALYHQGFNMARLHVETAIANHDEEQKPLAVIADVDDTLLLSSPYWGFLINEGKDFFDDTAWDEWVRENRMSATPGALAFLQYCRENNIEVFYVTSRDQGDDTFAIALDNLSTAGFPYADAEHLTVLRESSNKQIQQDRIRQNYNVVVMLGDNLNDFSRKYYVSDVEQRIELMEEDRSLYGTRYILFPNPTDGHWIRAIFGDSEPPPSDENRQLLIDVATLNSWEVQ